MTRAEQGGSRRRIHVAALALIAHFCGGCDRLLRNVRSQPQSPHEQYADALRTTGLDRTALGAGWLTAAVSSLNTAPSAELPFRESAYFPPADPRADAWRMSLRRGQRLEARVRREGSNQPSVFLDLFRRHPEGGEIERVAGADSGTSEIRYEVEEDGEYVVRVQPELLRGVRYELTLSAASVYAFPVEGRDTRAVRSRFGVPRDGGRRSHHGVDIFAPRGTPVLAVLDGRVTRVGETTIGGLVVWLSDGRRSQAVYYAHLDSQTVREGDRVRRGDTVGFVGNSGNARTTVPHLHFGIYRRQRGPFDPLPSIDLPPVPALLPAPASPGELARLGGLGRIRRAVDGLPARTLGVLVGASSSKGLRLRFPDGSERYVLAAAVEEPRPDQTLAVRARRTLTDQPRPDAASLASLPEGARVTALGRFESFDLVETPGGTTGWVARESPTANR